MRLARFVFTGLSQFESTAWQTVCCNDRQTSSPCCRLRTLRVVTTTGAPPCELHTILLLYCLVHIVTTRPLSESKHRVAQRYWLCTALALAADARIQSDKCRHLAASEGSWSVSEWLLSYGADINALDRFKRTPLEVCRNAAPSFWPPSFACSINTPSKTLKYAIVAASMPLPYMKHPTALPIPSFPSIAQASPAPCRMRCEASITTWPNLS